MSVTRRHSRSLSASFSTFRGQRPAGAAPAASATRCPSSGTRVSEFGQHQASAPLLELATAEPLWADPQAAIDGLVRKAIELEHTLIPCGLHVVGQPPEAAQRADMLDAAGVVDSERRAALDALLAADHETPAILHALDRGYLRPVPGGDPLRNPDVLPTGRNLHGFDPFRIPSAFAVKDGARQAERLLERHAAEGSALPETVAMVLWGIDNLKTEGGPIAQALWRSRPRRATTRSALAAWWPTAARQPTRSTGSTTPSG